MDARQYLAQKGLDGKPTSRPQLTLEEKSWARARASGEHRPRAGTPHDWEDWERYHEQLADGAEQLEQKIDPDEKASDPQSSPQQPLQKSAQETPAVQQYSPQDSPEDSSGNSPDQDVSMSGSAADRPVLQPFSAYVALSVLLPPLAVWLSDGGAKRGAVSLLLTLLGWLPGVAYALYWIMWQRDRN